MRLPAAIAFLLTFTASAKAQLSLAEQDAWRADLAFLRKEAPARHVSLFHHMTRTQFDSGLNAIEQSLAATSRNRVIVELEKLAALIGDGHSNVGPWRDSLIAFHSLPIALYWFSDGLIVRAADSAHSNLLGARVIAIGGVTTEAAIARVHPLISGDNEMAGRLYAPFLLTMPEVLEAVGLSSDTRRASFTLELKGRRVDVTLDAHELFPMLTGDADKQWMVRRGWVDARGQSPDPRWLRDPLDLYHFTYLADAKTLYCQINTIQQKPDDSLSDFMHRAIATADSAGASRFVLDLRLNSGGNGDFNKSIILPLLKSRYDTAGKLYVITGRRTFSAAQMLVTELEKWSQAIFVGEPTSSHGNQFGDSYRIVLPNSKVTFRVSTLWHQLLDSRDTRLMVRPNIPAELSFDDYRNGKDPALAAIISVRR